MEEKLKRFRTEIMGIATIMILLGHSVFYGEGYVNYGLLNDFVTLGYSGVDIFLFLSGFGLSYSIRKNDRITFWKHRVNRLLPSCLCVWLLYIIVHVSNFSLATIVDPIYMVYFGGYWYIGFLILAYLIFPSLFKYATSRNGYIIFTQSLLLSIICLIPFIYKGSAVSCNPLVCIVTRIPIFTMGMLYAMGKFDIIDKKYILYLLLFVGVLTLIPYYKADNLGGNTVFTTYYCILLLTSPIIYLYVCTLEIVQSVTRSSLRWLGNLSLEIYLVQVTIMPMSMKHFNSLGLSPIVNVIICIVNIVIISVIIKLVSRKIQALSIL